LRGFPRPARGARPARIRAIGEGLPDGPPFRILDAAQPGGAPGRMAAPEPHVRGRPIGRGARHDFSRVGAHRSLRWERRNGARSGGFAGAGTRFAHRSRTPHPAHRAALSRRRFARESECGIRRTWHGQQCGAQAQGRGPRAAHSQHAARAHLFGCTSLGFHGLLPPVGCRRVPSARRAGQGSAGRQSHGSGPGRQPGSGRGTPPPSGNLVCRMGGNGLVVPTLLTKLYNLLIAAASSLQYPFLLLVRLYWGFQTMQTGWGKLHNLAKVTEFFTSLGIPLPGLNAPFIVGLEFLGGILIMLGLGSRVVALLLTGDMIVAFVAADREALFSIFSDPDKFYAAAPYTFLVAFLIVLIFGPGRFSLDALLTKRLSGAAGTARPEPPAAAQGAAPLFPANARSPPGPARTSPFAAAGRSAQPPAYWPPRPRSPSPRPRGSCRHPRPDARRSPEAASPLPLSPDEAFAPVFVAASPRRRRSSSFSL